MFANTAYIQQVTDHNPIEEGLKPGAGLLDLVKGAAVTDHNPIEEGLKRTVNDAETIINQRHRS